MIMAHYDRLLRKPTEARSQFAKMRAEHETALLL